MFSKYWAVVVVTFIVQIIAVKAAYIERGYLAYGGEYLILPIMIVLILVVDEAIKNLRDSEER